MQAITSKTRSPPMSANSIGTVEEITGPLMNASKGLQDSAVLALSTNPSTVPKVRKSNHFHSSLFASILVLAYLGLHYATLICSTLLYSNLLYSTLL